MSAHHKKVSDLEAKQIEVDKKSLWRLMPAIGLGLAVIGFVLGFVLPAPAGPITDDAELWHG
jgi:hypothetical protein